VGLSHLDGGNSIKKMYLNKGDATGWAYDAIWSIPEHFAVSSDTGVRIDDINSDGLADIVIADGTRRKRSPRGPALRELAGAMRDACRSAHGKAAPSPG
jgi:hypothetical protein